MRAKKRVKDVLDYMKAKQEHDEAEKAKEKAKEQKVVEETPKEEAKEEKPTA